MLIANIASPNSKRNIVANSQVCVSFIDIFEQQGFKVHGTARIVHETDENWDFYLSALRELADESFPIKNIFEISIKSTSKIVAPSYFLFPDTTVEKQVQVALSTYKVQRN